MLAFAKKLFPVLAALPAITGCASILAMQGKLPLKSAEYVALGSSFAAGAAIGPVKPDTPERCSRTINNYPTLLANRMGLQLDDQTCGGATTTHLLKPWAELPAQIDAVGPSTRLVTVTIGGNDVNYVGALFMASCAPGEIVEAGEYRIPCIAPTPTPETAYANLEAGLSAIADTVTKRAPKARLIFVQYVTLVPEHPCGVATMSADNMAMTREIGRRLAQITASVAKRSDAMLLEAEKLSAGHTPCDLDPWANGMASHIDTSEGAPWHPNARGHEVIAERLAALLSAQ